VPLPVGLSSTFSYANAGVINNSTRFSVDISWPLTITPSSPVWNWIRFGSNWGTYGAQPDNPTSGTAGSVPASCSTFGNTAGSTPSAVNMQGYTNAQAQTYIINWISTNGNLIFNDGSALATIAKQLIGQQVNSNNNVIAMGNVKYNSTTGLITATYQGDLLTLVTYCGAAGVSVANTASAEVFSLPVGFTSSNVGASTPTETVTSFTVNVLTTGTSTISATSRFLPSASLTGAEVAQHTCAAGLASLVTNYIVSYAAVYDTTLMVGPRSINDIVVDSASDCYADTVTGYSFLGCNNYQCFYSVQLSTQCYTLSATGTTFTTCAATPAQAAQHPFSVNVYSCPLNQPTSGSCVVGDVSTSVVPSVQISAYPGSSSSQSYDVQAGIIAVPNDTNLANLKVLDNQLNGVHNATTDYMNTQLRSTESMTVLLRMSSPAMLAGFNLRIQLNSGFFVTPLDAFGNVLTSAPVLTFAQLNASNAFVTVPKNLQLYNPSAALLPVVAAQAALGNRGLDGFQIAVATLRSLSPANGYRVTVPYNYIIGSVSRGGGIIMAPMAARPHAARKLLQATATDPSAMATNGTQQFSFTIINEGPTGSEFGYWGMSRAGFIVLAVLLGIIACCMLFCMGWLISFKCRHRQGWLNMKSVAVDGK